MQFYYSICKRHLKKILGSVLQTVKVFSLDEEIKEWLDLFHPTQMRESLGVCLKFNSFETKLISSETTGLFFPSNWTMWKFEMFGHKAKVHAE